MIWIVFLSMMILAIGLIAQPWLRKTGRLTDRSPETLTYVRQLEELDSQLASGLLDEKASAALRLEIERRILTAAGSDPASAPVPVATGLVLGVSAIIFFAANLLYVYTGNLDVPSAAASQSNDAAELKADPDMQRLIAQLKARLLTDPSDMDGWLVLAGTSERLGIDDQFVTTVRVAFEGREIPPELRNLQDEALARLSGGRDLIAQLKAQLLANPNDMDGWIRLARDSEEREAEDQFINTVSAAFEGRDMPIELRIRQGEALVRLSGGLVTPAARVVFLDVLSKEPQHPGPLFYLGLGMFQIGDAAGALEIWQNLAAQSAADAPWRPSLDAQIARARRALGIEAEEEGANRGPALNADDLALVQNMSPEERRAFVEGMILRLRSRLEENPDDYQGWLQLAQAETVMGRQVLAIDALDRAKAGAPEAEQAAIEAEILRLSNLINGEQ